MMNDPTNRAIRAKVSRKVLKKPIPSLMSLWSSAVISAPVSTSTWSGTTCGDALDDLLVAHAVGGDHLDGVDLARCRSR